MSDQTYQRSNFPRIRPEWLVQVAEAVLEPELAIIDPHHHLWDVEGAPYRAPDLLADVTAGHRVLGTVFVECSTHFDSNAPADLAPVGETRFAATQAHEAQALNAEQHGLVAGIVACGDHRVADPRTVLKAHMKAGEARFRGVRMRAAWHPDPAFATPPGGPDADTLSSAAFDRYCALLAECDLTLDLWVYHTQLEQAAALARRHPRLTIILDHCGGPLGIGPYAGQHAAVLVNWRHGLAQLAACPNVFVKLGGLAMPRTGLAFAEAVRPGDSLQLAERWAPYIECCIELFGAERCMFESNFPVDKGSCNYVSLWNAFKRLSARYSAVARHDLLFATANRIYKLNLDDSSSTQR